MRGFTIIVIVLVGLIVASFVNFIKSENETNKIKSVREKEINKLKSSVSAVWDKNEDIDRDQVKYYRLSHGGILVLKYLNANIQSKKACFKLDAHVPENRSLLGLMSDILATSRVNRSIAFNTSKILNENIDDWCINVVIKDEECPNLNADKCSKIKNENMSKVPSKEIASTANANKQDTIVSAETEKFIYLKNGNTFTGKVVKKNEQVTVVEVNGKMVNIQTNSIMAIMQPENASAFLMTIDKMKRKQ